MNWTSVLLRLGLQSSLLLALHLLLAPTRVQAQVPAGQGLVADSTELRVLRELYAATGGDQWAARTNWPTTPAAWAAATLAQTATWYGVVPEGGDVTQLRLASNQLRGALPAGLGQLRALRECYLDDNQLTALPASVGRLAALRYLNLSHNQLPALPDSLARLGQLSDFNASYNRLSGPLPACLRPLRGLYRLALHGNQLSGPLPKWVGEWTGLMALGLSHNAFDGHLPEALATLPGLGEVDLTHNRFEGSLPADLGKLRHLRVLAVSHNRFSGLLPASLGQCANLQYLFAADNLLGGPLPAELGRCLELRQAFLSGNRFEGPLPPELGRLRDLHYLDLQHNRLTGKLPAAYKGLASLYRLGLSHNRLTGPVPDSLSASFLNLDHNRFSGPVPATLRFYQLTLDHNDLTRIPDYDSRLGYPHLEVHVTGNFLDFGSYEPNQWQPGVWQFWDYGQRTPGPADTLAVVPGTFPVLTDSVGGRHNRYQWQRQLGQTGAWTDLPGDTLATLRLERPAREADEGTYRKRVTNRWVPGITLYSRGVYLTLLPYAPLAFNEPTDGRDCPARETAGRPADRSGARDSVNFVRTFTARAAFTEPAALEAAPGDQVQVQTTYLDGLGRLVQTVTRQASPAGRDLVQPLAYDGLGRQPRQYLPYSAAPLAGPDQALGAYRPNAPREQYDFHAGTGDDVLTQRLTANLPKTGVAYAETLFEASPLHRVQAQAAPGESWRLSSGHALTTAERPSLLADSIPRYVPGYGSEREELAYTGLYGDGELWVSEQQDEERHPTRIFTDKEGRVVLRRVATGRYFDQAKRQTLPRYWQDTYYCYDDFGRLRATVPPLAARQLVRNGYRFDGAGTELLLFRTHFDAQGRPVEQRTPDVSGYTYTVYDALDRPVLSQDPAQRGRGEWTASKYDALGRVVLTALVYFAPSTDRAALQALADQSLDAAGAQLYEAPSATPVLPGLYYTDRAFPRLLMAAVAGRPPQLLSATYYDGYDFDQDGTDDAAYSARYDQQLGGPAAAPDLRVTSQATRTLTRVLGPSSTAPVRWLTSTRFFDDKLRLLQVQDGNARGGGDTVTTRYDFAGQALASYATHTGAPNALASQRVAVRSASTFDHAGRLLTSTQQVNDQPARELSRNAYNENGQLASQRLGQWQGRALQKVDYGYNIRGWHTRINDAGLRSETVSATTPADVWGWQLDYDCGMNTPAYNGNIAGQRWRSRRDTVERAYGYRYDGASRLLQGDFIARGVNGGWNAERSDYRFWATSYDANGNLLTLRRRAPVQAPVHATGRGLYAETDNLRYRYTPTVSGNRLVAVDDLAPAPSLFGVRQPVRPDFQDVTGARDYAYDVSGSLLSDNNKQLRSIRYNFLHLPEQLVFATPGDSIRFIYTAAGQKVAKLVYEHGQPLKRTDYVGAWQYEQDTLRWLSSSAGRTLREVDKRSGAVRFVNEYTINDNLGNLRVAFRAGTRRTYRAGLEPGASEQERRDFDPASVSAPIANSEQAAAGAYAAKLTAGGSTPQPLGPTKLWSVQAGDTLSVETLAHYEQAPNASFRFTLLPFINTFLGQTPTTSGDAAPKTRSYTYLQLGLSGVPALPSFGAGVPRAYLRVLLYKADSTYLDSRLMPISSAAKTAWEPLRLRPWVLPQGVAYAQVYVGNESDAPVWFDELRIEHRQGLQVQENHYDPFGLELAGLNPRSPGLRTLNQYQFNGKEKQLDLGLNWNHQDWRFYDAQLGRWHVVDRKADEGDQESWSTYQFGMNNAVRYNDPDGECPLCITAAIGGLVGGVVSAGIAIADGKDTKDVLTAATAGAVGGAIAGSGIGLIAELGVGVGGAVAINAAAGFVGGAGEEATSQVIQVARGKAPGFQTGKIATNAMVGAASNVVGGAFGDYVVEPGVKRLAAKVAAGTAARTAGPGAQRAIRTGVAQANKALRNNNPRLNAAVGQIVKGRRKEAASLGEFVGKKASAAGQVGVETGAQAAENAANNRANKRNKRE